MTVGVSTWGRGGCGGSGAVLQRCATFLGPSLQSKKENASCRDHATAPFVGLRQMILDIKLPGER